MFLHWQGNQKLLNYQPLNTIPNLGTIGITSDRFGSSLAINSSYIAIGSEYEDGVYGAVYVLDKVTQSTVYTLYGRAAGISYFGNSVAMSESYLIAGAYGSSGGGKAAIYSLSTGSRLFTLNNPNSYGTSSGDYFGKRVAITENYAVVSATQEDNASGTDSGVVYIYSVSTGSLLYTIPSPNTASYARWGQSLAVNGDNLIIGGNRTLDHAYIYSLSTGTLIQTLNFPGTYVSTTTPPTSPYPYYGFGMAVSISNNYCAVADFNETANTTTAKPGAVYIFRLSDYSLVSSFINPYTSSSGQLEQGFGGELSMTDSVIVVSDMLAYSSASRNIGRSYAYKIDDGQLLNTFISELDTSSTANLSFFGKSVATDGDIIAVGEYWWPGDGSTEVGKVYLYKT